MMTVQETSANTQEPVAWFTTLAARLPNVGMNYLVLAGGECVAKVLGFVGFVTLGRVLGVEAYGQVEFVLATMVFFTLPVDFGLGVYGAREVARRPERSAKLLQEISSLRFILACASFTLLALLTAALTQRPDVRLLLLLYGGSLFAAPGLLQWYFQGKERMGWVAAASVVRQGTWMALLLVMLWAGAALPWVGVCECVAVAAVVALNLAAIRRRLGERLPLPTFRAGILLEHFRHAAPIGLSELAWAFLWYSSTVLLGTLTEGPAVGWFGAAHRIVMALHTFVWLYFFNLLPSLVRTVDQPQERLQALMGRSLNLTAWTGCAVALALTLGGGRLMSLAYGPEFTAAATPLAILAWILPVALVSGHYRYVLIAYGAQRLEFACSAAAAVTAVAGGLALIPKYEAAGAATALLLASLVNLAYAFVLARYRVLARTDAAPCLDKNG